MDNEDDNSELFEKRLKYTYNNNTTSAIKRILFCRYIESPNVIYYGSSVYKINLYAGDLDAMEYIQENNTNIIVSRLQDIIKDILKDNAKGDNLYIIGDIKSGLDDRFDIDIGYIKNMKLVGFNQKNIIKQIDKIKYLLDIKEYEIITSLVMYYDADNIEITDFERNLIKQSNPKLYNSVLSRWLAIFNFFYDKRVIRWKPVDILRGYVEWNNKKFYLKDTIKNGMTKYDLIYQDTGKYMEVSNTMFFNIGGKLNMSDDPKNLIKDLQNMVFKKLYDIKDLNFLKAFKLSYSICKLTGNIKYMNVINKLLIGDFGKLGKVISELKSCKDVLKLYKLSNIKDAYIINITYDIIFDIIQNINTVLDSTILFKIKNLSLFNDITNIIIDIQDNKSIIDIDIIIDAINMAVNQLQYILNVEVVIYADKNGLYPMNKNFLP